MQDAKHKESTHGVVENWAFATVELRNRGQGEGKWDVFKEITMGADVDLERVASARRILTKVLVILDTVIADSVRKEDQIGGEWKCPSTSNGCQLVSEVSNESEGEKCLRSNLGTGTPIPIVELMISK